MASIANDQDPEQQTAQQPAAGAPVSVGGTAGASASGGQGSTGGATAPAAGASPVQQNQGAQANNGYTDVGSYLDANQAGSQTLGNQVASHLTGDYNSVKGGVDQSAQNAQSLADQGYTHENSSLIAQAASNPISAAADPNNVSAFQSQLNDTYTGPTAWGDYGTQQGNVASAQQEGNLYNTAGGLNVLAQQAEGGQGSQGVNQLDTLLLGGSPTAMTSVKAASDPFATLGTYLDNANTGVTGAITTGQNNAAQTSADALNAFTGSNGTLTNLNNTINGTVATDLSQAQAQQAALKADIANLYGGKAADNSSTTLGTYGGGSTPWYNTTNYSVGQLSPQDLASMGLTQAQWTALQQSMQQAGTSTGYSGHNFGANSPTSQIDIGQYLSQQDPTAAINAGTVATPEQYQQMSAIQALLGGKTPQNTAINPALASLAGTYNPNDSLATFNYQNALNSAQTTAAAEAKAAQDEANAISSSADSAHNASKGGGFLGGLEKAADIINPVALLGNQAVYNQAKKVI